MSGAYFGCDPEDGSIEEPGTDCDDGDDDTHLLLGTHETRNNVGIAPALSKWLGEELAKESLAAKERRKAREERQLATGKAAKKT